MSNAQRNPFLRATVAVATVFRGMHPTRRAVLLVATFAFASAVSTPLAEAAPSNWELAEHAAERHALLWAFDQHAFPPYGDTREPLGYLFDGCRRTAPGRFTCRVGVGVAYGQTRFVHRARVRVTVTRGRATAQRLRRTATVGLAGDEVFTTSIVR